MNTEAANKFIDAGYEYIKDRETEIDNMVETRDTVDDFKSHQNYLESRGTTSLY